MKLKSAFTLAEIMMFLVVISILLTVIFSALKPQQVIADKNVKHKYGAAYDALNLAIYDLMAKEDTDPFRKNDDNPKKAFKKLCTGLSEYINNTSVNCEYPLASNVAYMKDETFDFRDLKPHITALNGINFYISELITDDTTPNNNRSYFSSENPEYTLKFFMVYADLNGAENPKKTHSIYYDANSKKHPSVYAFAIIPTGEAIPIGVAEYNIKYLATRIAYKENHSIYYSPFYSFRQAKHAAWNYYNNQAPDKQKSFAFKEKISFTYNDYIKEILERNSSELYKFNDTKVFPETFDTGLYSKCVPADGTALTTFDMCGITVDTMHYGVIN